MSRNRWWGSPTISSSSRTPLHLWPNPTPTPTPSPSTIISSSSTTWDRIRIKRVRSLPTQSWAIQKGFRFNRRFTETLLLLSVAFSVVILVSPPSGTYPYLPAFLFLQLFYLFDIIIIIMIFHSFIHPPLYSINLSILPPPIYGLTKIPK